LGQQDSSLGVVEGERSWLPTLADQVMRLGIFLAVSAGIVP
jgi:hypothetical protein